MYGGVKSQWDYLGAQNSSSCERLPSYPDCNPQHATSSLDDLVELCQWQFNNNIRKQNQEKANNYRPKMHKMCQVRCPNELVFATGIKRNDELNKEYTCDEHIVPESGGGSLMTTMDCAKPAYAWPAGLPKKPFDHRYNVVVPCRRDGYVRINAMK